MTRFSSPDGTEMASANARLDGCRSLEEVIKRLGSPSRIQSDPDVWKVINEGTRKAAAARGAAAREIEVSMHYTDAYVSFELVVQRDKHGDVFWFFSPKVLD